MTRNVNELELELRKCRDQLQHTLKVARTAPRPRTMACNKLVDRCFDLMDKIWSVE